MSFIDKVVFITGASTGIGVATARRFVEAGAKVAVSDITSAHAPQLLEELGEENARFYEVDVRDDDSISAAISSTVEAFGRLDVVFNNAGVGLNAPLVDHTAEQIDNLLGVNLRGVILVAREAMPHLLANESGGVIINNASNGGLVGRAPDPVYTASKHGVIGFTKSLAVAHAHQNIRANAVCPGPIDTPMLWNFVRDVESDDEALHRLLLTCPMPRVASAEEVADTVLFLASDSARFISGAAVPIDGAKAAGVMPSHRYRLDFDLLDDQSMRYRA